MKVSVIVAAYNAESTIEKTLESLADQTYTDLEVVLVVDGGRDKTLEICRAMEAKDSRFRCVWQENAGLAAARNTGLDLITGALVAFVDADDYVDPDFIHRLVEALGDCDLSICGYVFEQADGTPIYTTNPWEGCLEGQALLERLITAPRERGCYMCNKLYRTQHIRSQGIRFPEGIRCFEDIFFNYHYIRKNPVGSLIAQPLYHYVSWPDTGLTRGVTENGTLSGKWLHYTDVFDRLLEQVEGEPGWEEFYHTLRMLRVWHSATALRVLAAYGMKSDPAYFRMRQNVLKDLPDYMGCRFIGAKKKLGAVLTLLAPKLSFWIWQNNK